MGGDIRSSKKWKSIFPRIASLSEKFNSYFRFVSEQPGFSNNLRMFKEKLLDLCEDKISKDIEKKITFINTEEKCWKNKKLLLNVKIRNEWI